MSIWAASTAAESYSHYFAKPRPDPPPDTCTSVTMSHQSNSVSGNVTTTITFHDASTLTHTLNGQTLDIKLVEDVLVSTRPIVSGYGGINWQWTEWPEDVAPVADAEPAYYPWLQWVVFRPAAHAVAAVRDRLYNDAHIAIPPSLQGESKTRTVTNSSFRGSTDILHEFRRSGELPTPYTAHEVKRSRVLAVAATGGTVLEELVDLANVQGGSSFRDADVSDKARSLLSQAIDELILYSVNHIVISTQDQYVLLHLSELQFCISRVYTIRDSPSQGRDMVELVLFYTHAALAHREPYPTSPSTTPTFRVTVPYFPRRIFQPREGFFSDGHLIHRVKLSALVPSSRKSSIPWPLPARLHGYDGSSRHDGDIVISFGRLVFWLFQAHIVAKLAFRVAASDRLRREFEAYNVLHALQGVAIPILLGLYRNEDDGSSVLIMSNAGVPLTQFDELSASDRHKLLAHLICLHQAGVQHNDMEPRNIVMSASRGPVIIDFDNASLGHSCPGLSCTELLQVAHHLKLNLEFELLRSDPVTSYPRYRFVLFLLLSVLLALIFLKC